MTRLDTRWWAGTALFLLVVVGALVVSTAGAHGEQRSPDHNPALFPAHSHPYGSSMEHWAGSWWRWALSVPAARSPFFSSTGDCGVGQTGPVFFVPPFAVGSTDHSRSCVVEEGKAVAVSLSTVLTEFPCPDPAFRPAPGQSLLDFLRATSVAGNADIAQIEVTLDGEPLKDLLGYHFVSDELLYIRGDRSLQSKVDSCITGEVQPAALDAYFILFRPLPPGHHTIVRRVVTTKGRVTGPNTTEIEVVRERAL